MDHATLRIDGETIEMPLVKGTEGERGIDIGALRKETGTVTLDPGYANTGSCESSITYIDGQKGVLRYRGYPIEQLAEHSSFPEVSYLVMHGELPTEEELDDFTYELTHHSLLHEDMKKFFEGYPARAQPMSVLSAMVASLSAYYPRSDDSDTVEQNITRLLAKLKTIAAFSYKKSIGQPYIYPQNHLSYAEDFLHMMFAVPSESYDPPEVLTDALELLLILHVDHTQNCSASTVRMVGSSGASLFASIAAGINALSGPLHGGANQRVVEMLEQIRQDDGNYEKYIEKAKDKEDPFRLMGFGHRVYKNFDPRAKIIKSTADRVFDQLGLDDPLLDIARNLEQAALDDDYFVERRIYPNVDFYSGILYRAMGIPPEMFTVMFALGRLPGWIAQWLEMRQDPDTRIHRPRQIYQGATKRDYVPMTERSA